MARPRGVASPLHEPSAPHPRRQLRGCGGLLPPLPAVPCCECCGPGHVPAVRRFSSGQRSGMQRPDAAPGGGVRAWTPARRETPREAAGPDPERGPALAAAAGSRVPGPRHRPADGPQAGRAPACTGWAGAGAGAGYLSESSAQGA
jgi:hypothetical protein